MSRGRGPTLVRMVESSPSQGVPERDPDHPTSSGEPARDRVVSELEALAARVDPVPEKVVEEARRAFKTRRAKKVGPRGSSGSDPA